MASFVRTSRVAPAGIVFGAPETVIAGGRVIVLGADPCVRSCAQPVNTRAANSAAAGLIMDLLQTWDVSLEVPGFRSLKDVSKSSRATCPPLESIANRHTCRPASS